MFVRLFPLLLLIIVTSCAPRSTSSSVANPEQLSAITVEAVTGQTRVLAYNPPAPGEPGEVSLQFTLLARNTGDVGVQVSEFRYEIKLGEHSVQAGRHPIFAFVGAGESIPIRLQVTYSLPADSPDVVEAAKAFTEAGVVLEVSGSFHSGASGSGSQGAWRMQEEIAVVAEVDDRLPRTTLLIDRSSVDPTATGARFTFVLEFENLTPYGYFVHAESVQLALSGEHVAEADFPPVLIPANKTGQVTVRFNVDSSGISERAALVTTGAMNGFLTGITLSGTLERDYLGAFSAPFPDKWETHGFIRRY